MPDNEIIEEAHNPHQVDENPLERALEKTKEEEKEYKKPEVCEGSGIINKISKQYNDGRVYYRMTIGNIFYTKWINQDWEEKYVEDLREGDQVTFTWTGKAVGDKVFRNIRKIEKITGSKQLTDYSKGKTPEDWDKINAKKIDGITFGMAMNNAAVLFASMAAQKEDPEIWIKENIGNALWKAIEQKLHENYVEQRKEITGE